MKESEYFPAANFDGCCDLPVGDSYFQSLKPSFDEVNQLCSLGNGVFSELLRD
jgi:hypothetical protein